MRPYGRPVHFRALTVSAVSLAASLAAALALLPASPASGHRPPTADLGARTSPAARAACPIAPAVKQTSTRYGLNVDTMDRTFTQEMSLRKQVYGRQPVIRVWDNGVPPSNAWKVRTPTLTKDTAVVTSFEMPPAQVLSGKYDQALRQFFATAPSGHDIYWTYRHEPELRVQARLFSPAQFRDAWRHIARIAGALCRPNLIPTLVLMGWTADPRAGDDWRQYYPGADYVSVLAWDPYNGPTDRIPPEYRSPARMYDAVVRASAGAKKPWAIAETGSPLIAGDRSGVRRAAWLTQLGAYAKTHGAVWMTYFDFHSRVDFRLRDQPSINAWRTLMRNGG
jgi:hypothetical protein